MLSVISFVACTPLFVLANPLMVEESVIQPGEADPIQPPEDSPPLLRNVQLTFPTQGNVSSVDPQTYLFHMEVRNHVSLPSQGKWMPYTEEVEQIILDDFQRLWETGFLEDIWIEVIDEPWNNGVVGKRVIYNFEERERVKIVNFEGSDELKRADIDDAMQENGLTFRLDTFLDPGEVKRVKGLLKFMFAEKGYEFAEVTHEVEELPGGPKTVRVTFNMEEGPKVYVEEISFIGNEALSDGKLKRKMKSIKERWWLSWITKRGTYKQTHFEDDADRIIVGYRNEGYIDAQVGQPVLDYLEESVDGKSRGLRLRIPIEEGERYRVGNVDFDGNDILNDEALASVFENLESGEYYKEEDVRKAFDTVRELYGSLGYYEMTLFPDLQPRTVAEVASAVNDAGNSDTAFREEGFPTRLNGDPLVDVTIRVQEGERYYINRITFVGNETTHDEVVRREMQLLEKGVFNTEALKYSIRRINQLGFFEPLEEDQSVQIAKVEEADTNNEVNLTINLSENNLNQISFGAGMSQYDGFFGQLSFQTSNFLGRGETLGANIMAGSRVRNMSLQFTEPFIFGRDMSGSVAVFTRKFDYIGSYTEESIGGTLTAGWPLSVFSRFFMSYSYEETGVKDINPYFFDDPFLLESPFFQDALLMGSDGRRSISKVTPMWQFNTIDHPVFPTSGTRYQAGIDIAGLGGNTSYLKPTLGATWYMPHTSRTTIGIRTQFEYLRTGDVEAIPVFERLWLGGEYSVRGYDIRRIGPTLAEINPDIADDTVTGRSLIGGNKSVLFNFEYQFTVAGPVRLIGFYDAGQVRDFGKNFTMNDFKTSTGVELRFFMPMLNVPFRLIYAWNPQREGVYDDRLRPADKSGFRFAVGTTF